jgi:hypothetical protein
MDATAGISWFRTVGKLPLDRAGLRNSAAWVLAIGLALTALFFLTRRCAGALVTPLSALLLIVVGIVAAAVVGAVHVLMQADDRRRFILWRLTGAELLSVAALPLFAAAITLPGNGAAGITLLWLMVGGAELGLWQLRRSRRFTPTGEFTLPTARDAGWNLFPRERDATATQQLVYRRMDNGTASVEGWLHTTFLTGQRTAVVHVAFCPAFAQTPNVEAELTDGPPCEIRPTLVLPWGVRWEVKLDTAATAPATATLEFIAQEMSGGGTAC